VKEWYSHPKHGMEGTPEYKAWEGMIQRCTNPRTPCFADYGGRGIAVCAQWLRKDGFKHFFASLGFKPEPKRLYQLERVDNELGYTPENCKWATRSENLKNRRRYKAIQNFSDDEILLEFNRRQLGGSNGA